MILFNHYSTVSSMVARYNKCMVGVWGNPSLFLFIRQQHIQHGYIPEINHTDTFLGLFRQGTDKKGGTGSCSATYTFRSNVRLHHI